jgi:hypothetical protein
MRRDSSSRTALHSLRLERPQSHLRITEMKTALHCSMGELLAKGAQNKVLLRTTPWQDSSQSREGRGGCRQSN